MATYQLNQTRSDGTPVSPVQFTIPDEAGTYQLALNSPYSKTFTGNIQGIEKVRTHAINETVSGTTTLARVQLPSNNTTLAYMATATIALGTGTLTNLVATPTPGSNTLEATATYDETTGVITVNMYASGSRRAVSATVKGAFTPASVGTYTYRIDVTLSNGQQLSDTFEVSEE